MKDGKNVVKNRAGMTYDQYRNSFDALINSDMQNVYWNDDYITDQEKELDNLMKYFRDMLIGDKYVCAVRDEKRMPRIFPPIRPFYEVQDKITHDILFETFKNMPKGANLHIHTSSTLGAVDFIEMLEKYDNGQDGFVIVNFNDDDIEKKIYKYTIFFVTKFIPPGYKRLSQLSDEGKQELISYLTISETSVSEEQYIWDEFDKIFQRVYHVLSVRKIYLEYYTRAFKKMIEDNTSHVELRCTPSVLKDSNDDEFKGGSDITDIDEAKFESVKLIYEAYQAAKTECKDFTLRLIITSSRKKKKDNDKYKDPVKDYKDDIEWVLKYRNQILAEDEPFIIGYDLVSEEDQGWNTDDVSKAFFDDNGKLVDVDFFFHDGESCWADNKNLFSAVTLGSVRVGHGINLYHFPVVLDEVIKNNVVLEVCPISNQLLRYTQDLRIHPIAEYMKRGINCVICNDDPQIFNYNGLAYDFWEVYYSQMIGIAALKKLVLNSIIYSRLGDDLKDAHLLKFDNDWNKFVVNEIKRLKSID